MKTITCEKRWKKDEETKRKNEEIHSQMAQNKVLTEQNKLLNEQLVAYQQRLDKATTAAYEKEEAEKRIQASLTMQKRQEIDILNEKEAHLRQKVARASVQQTLMLMPSNS